MKVLFDGRWIEDKIELSVLDRGLQFGDGLFETIAVRYGEAKYLKYHFERLSKGANLLNLSLETEDFENLIELVLNENQLIDGSLKLMVWRKHTGSKGYNFDSSESHYMLIPKYQYQTDEIIESAGFAKNVTFSYSILSGIKTMNALPYILAANERKHRKLDELIVLNAEGYICECVSSNIFWLKDNVCHTPPLTSGCLDGVMRRVLIERMVKAGLTIQESLSTQEELLSAEAIFTTNSNGIRFIEKLENNSFDVAIVKSKLAHLGF